MLIRTVLFALAATGLLLGCRSTSERAAADKGVTPQNMPPVASSEMPAAGTAAPQPESKPAEEDKPDPAVKRAKLVRELAIANEKVKRAQRAVKDQEADNAAAIEQARREQELARTKLGNFEQKHAPLRLEEARLNLRGAQDNLREAEEELQQLEMMYAEGDLADKTSEIVLNRGKRRIDRARIALTNQQTALANLENHTLTYEASELRSGLAQKSDGLTTAQRAAEAKMHDKHIDLMAAEAEVMRIQQEIADVDKEASKEANKDANGEADKEAGK
jgi:hypothetical protein